MAHGGMQADDSPLLPVQAADPDKQALAWVGTSQGVYLNADELAKLGPRIQRKDPESEEEGGDGFIESC